MCIIGSCIVLRSQVQFLCKPFFPPLMHCIVEVAVAREMETESGGGVSTVTTGGGTGGVIATEIGIAIAIVGIGGTGGVIGIETITGGTGRAQDRHETEWNL